MGVPSFYRWLTKKYESIVVDAKEENGECVDSSLPNPNGREFDNLYLDMNGIIHPCFHPEDNDDMSTPKTFEDVFNNIFGYIDRLFNIVRPRKLLYLAIDGVAPRAKMNQQRTRRFRNAKDAEEVEKEEERLRREFLLDGKQVLPKQKTELFDSNIITPGTEFMFKLSKELQTYVHLRMKSNPGWKNVKVILSDSSVPGEGEHKIFSFIRLQRTFPEYDPNTRHCVYGLDADLIMLALATHEINFSILREDIMAQIPNSGGHTTQVTASRVPENMTKSMKSFEKWGETEVPEKSSSEGVYKAKKSAKRPYQFLHTWILREYLKMDMEIHDLPEKFQPDFERLVDDFIFICFFSGNDFLPHMPSLYIHEGGIDLLMHLYKTEFKVLGGYLVDMQRVNDKKSGYIKLKRVEKFILLVGNYEENIFKKRADLRERILKKILKEYENSRCGENEDLGTIRIDLSTLKISGSSSEKRHTCSDGVNDPEVILENTKELKDKLKEYSRKASDSFQNGGLGTDKVKLHLPGYRERYYMEKFELTSPVDIESTRRAVVEKYTEGLCWVTLYYFSGVPSWTWYYPYHYGPFASDMKGISQVKPQFQKGLPFKPFEQLMGVFPPRSAHALPIPYQRLMKDETSSIIDFYRTDFRIDVDGTRFTWQGICKIPFIEEARLIAETRKLESELKGDEAIRNSEGLDILFLGRTSLEIISEPRSTDSNKHNNELRIDAKLSGGLNGFLLFKMGENEADRLPRSDSDILCVFYKLPPHRMHNPRLLEGVVVPEETITEADIHDTQLWHEYQGHRPVTGLQNPHRQWKTDKKVTNSTPPVIMKNAGIGWGSGRGKVRAEEAERTSSAPGELPKLTAGSNFGGNSSTGHYRLHNFNSPLQCNNEKRSPIFGRGARGITETFRPNQPQVYNVQQAIRRGETRTSEKSRSNPPETSVSRARNFGRGETQAPNHPANNNVWRATSFGRGETRSGQAPNHPANNNVWRATSFGRGETRSAWTSTSSQLANNNVWRETGSARGQTQGAWTLSSNERANSNVWRATNSGIGERGAGVTVRPNQLTNNNQWGSTRSGRPGNWRSGESGAQ
ncbi:putative 5'-_3' exoribonuclease [Heracleum sosnowskyi]|uniref:5'-3' exoribonuclease n=1 Tax=Heracleum sosnowskyi TaxID=360622 RepID=A0AAD8MS35_9APIA|nr:putative 5'->3' exoribonuclease [Heracleum sosnowskyi]